MVYYLNIASKIFRPHSVTTIPNRNPKIFLTQVLANITMLGFRDKNNSGKTSSAICSTFKNQLFSENAIKCRFLEERRDRTECSAIILPLPNTQKKELIYSGQISRIIMMDLYAWLWNRCNCYRISLSPRLKGKLDRAVAYLKERRVHCLQPTGSLEVRKEPDFGLCDQEPFFCIHNVPGIHFPVLFLVNAVLHKGIVNRHQLSEDFFSLLRSQVCGSIPLATPLCFYMFVLLILHKGSPYHLFFLTCIS